MKGIILIALLALTACSSNKTTQPPAPIEPPTSIELPPIVIPGEGPAEAYIGQIQLIALTHPVASFVWGNRGKAPMGLLKGMALVYARAVCTPNPIVASTVKGSDSVDAMTYYGIQPSNLNVHAFMIGLAMRESSGRYCTGRDGSANNIQADTAEGGIMQTSYDSRGADPSLAPFFKNYDKKCFLETFKEGVSSCGTSYAKNWGTGADGLAFQKKMKECPAFAIDYAAITMRKLRRHYGPINRKEVLFPAEAVDFLAQVERVVRENPSVCSAL